MTIAHAADVAAILDIEQSQSREDITFFTDVASELRGPILELGCGAGRLAIPLARAGVEIVGLDISAVMLERFKEKLASESPEIRRRISLLCGDMRRFSLKRQFRGVFCSSNTLFLLGSENDVGEALARIRLHLAPDGMLVIDAAAIDSDARSALAKYPKGDIPDLDLSEGPGNPRIWRTHSIKPKNEAAHSMKTPQMATRFSITYKYFDAPDSVCFERSEDVVLLRPRELTHLMRKHGYEIVDKFGWYDRRWFSDGERKLIVLARKKE